MSPTAASESAESYTAGPQDIELLEQTLAQNLDATAERFPDAVAVDERFTGRQWTHAALAHDSRRVAKALIAAGYGHGDRVGMWSPNVAEWATLLYGAARAGVILVNLNPAYRAHELTYVVEQCAMRGLVVACPDARTDLPRIARQVAREGAPALRQLILLPSDADAVPVGGPDSGGSEGDGPGGDAVVADRSGEPVTETGWDAFLAAGASVSDEQLAERQARTGPTDPVNLQYTSGTTGFPKGVTLTHRNILNNGFHIGELLRYSEQDAVVLPVPFFHCFGMVIGLIAAVSHGSALVLPSRAFDPTAALVAVADTRATSLYGVPTMFIAMLGRPEAAELDLTTLRTGVMAGSPCPEEVMKQVIDRLHMSDVAICYGMTETAPVSTMTRAEDSLERRTRTVGRSMPHVETKIVDPATGEPVRRGATGELCTRGYSVMAGYWDEPERTAAVLDVDGWMHSGDLASMDEEGYVSIEGRIKDLVIRGGENISPREVEEFLYTHPDIQDVQVIGVPDPTYGEELMACVILKEGASALSAGDLKAYCTGRIAHYKIPRHVRLLTAFPMTVSGKVRKVELREEAAAALADEA